MHRSILLAATCLTFGVGLAGAAGQQPDPAKQPTDVGNNLSALPKGEQTLAGVKFKIEESLIQLGTWVLPGKPAKVAGIKVERPFARLHVLHATGNTQQDQVVDGTLVGRYLMHYEDDSIDSVPMVYGKNIREWWFFDGAETEVTGGKIAWQGKNRAATGNNATIGLYLLTWENPHPDKKVVRIDCSARQHIGAAPFCVAMTVEDKDGKGITHLNLQPRANQRLDKDFHQGNEEDNATAKQPSRIYVDEDFGFKVTAPGKGTVLRDNLFPALVKWQRKDPADFGVSAYGGEICRVWAPDSTASITVFVQKPGKALSARALLTSNAVAETARIGAEVWKQEVRTIGGMKGMFLAYTAKGTGAATDGKGSVPTTAQWAAVPRGEIILNFLLTAPEDDIASHAGVFEAMLRSLEISGAQTEEQKAAR